MIKARAEFRKQGYPVDAMTDEQIADLARAYAKTIAGAGQQLREALQPIVDAYMDWCARVAKALRLS